MNHKNSSNLNAQLKKLLSFKRGSANKIKEKTSTNLKIY